MNKLFLFLIIISFIFLPLFIEAQNILGQEVVFNIESNFDLFNRTETIATLIKISPKIYWYLDNNWWQELDVAEQEEVKQSLISLEREFREVIYPTLTANFGLEPRPGIDGDIRITILVHPMKKEVGGYFDSSDGYPKEQVPESNEREMIYLNTQHINTPNAKVVLAHEFLHLITFNQKDKLRGVVEDIWLNEARAEYTATLLGYDKEYEGSNLQRRVKAFLKRSSDSLTEWRGKPADYGVVNLFIQYLVDHYGLNILTNSLQMEKIGIESLNAVLMEKGFEENFSQIFANWTIAVLINDCQVGEKYCYLNPHLRNLRITPLINYLPFIGEGTLSVVNTTRDWAGNWHKFVGGRGVLKFEFQAHEGAIFKVPYIIERADGELIVNNLSLDEGGHGKIIVEDFGTKNISLTVIPIAQNKISDFRELEPARTFFWSASILEKLEKDLEKLEKEVIQTPVLEKPIAEMTKTEILAKIAEIRKTIALLQAKLNELLGAQISCRKIEQNLYFGLRNNPQVKCLQEFLKAQGPEIYPEGLVTGNFFSLTKMAVIRFQEKYSEEILAPWGLERGTGYVGPTTRQKINQLLTGL